MPVALRSQPHKLPRPRSLLIPIAMQCVLSARPVGHAARITAQQRSQTLLRQLVARPQPVQRRSLRAAAAQGGDSHAGHAKLHDFCMTIPYGAIALLSGLVAVVFKAPAVGLQLAGAGGVVSLCSVLSLKSWKSGGGSAPFTLVSAGASSWVAFQMWQRVQASIAPVPSGILLALSAALAAFCVYNVVAGGNPPPSKAA